MAHPPYPVWDLPTRVFHWSLVVLVFASWLSYEFEWYEVHRWSGYTLLVLVGFRLGWGVVGSRHSRFADFVRGPGAVWRYFRRGESDTPGHNPAGGWSVLAMLGLLLVQGVTGLFNSDGLFFEGPLYNWLDSTWTDRMGALHEQVFWVLLGFIALHVATVSYYQWKPGHPPLIVRMITGGRDGEAPPAPLWRSLALVLLAAGLLALAIALAPEPETYW